MYVELEQLNETRAELAEVRRLNPQVTLEGIRRTGGFASKDRTLAERQLADMAKAGLK